MEMIFSPIAFVFMGYPVRWYSLAYLVSYLFAYRYAKYLAYETLNLDYSAWMKLQDGMMISGLFFARFLHCLVYDFDYYSLHLIEIFYFFQGGMSFFGGILGFVLYGLYWSNFNLVKALKVYDICVSFVPVGLFFGRLANIVNSECVGLVGDGFFAIRYPLLDNLPRYPVQIWESLTEGLILGLILNFVPIKTTGLRSALFLFLYAFFRFFIEQYKEVDVYYLGISVSIIFAIFCMLISILLLYFVLVKKNDCL